MILQALQLVGGSARFSVRFGSSGCMGSGTCEKFMGIWSTFFDFYFNLLIENKVLKFQT